MPITHIFLVLLVVFVWGMNFIFLKLALGELPPLLLCALRFILASIPLIFFMKPPAIPFRTVILYGLVTFAMQFSFLFIGMHLGVTPGMAALGIQVQVFFSMFIAAIVLRDMPRIWQIAGALISFVGIAVVACNLNQEISFWGFIFVLAAAAVWGFGNLIIKKNSNINMMALVVWGSFVSCIPLLIASLTLEGPSKILAGYHHLTWVGISSVLYTTYISTWVGYGVWNWLLSRHPVGAVVPFTLLVPIVGIVSSILVLGESFESWKILAGLLVLSGLGVNLFGGKLLSFWRSLQGKNIIEQA